MLGIDAVGLEITGSHYYQKNAFNYIDCRMVNNFVTQSQTAEGWNRIS